MTSQEQEAVDRIKAKLLHALGDYLFKPVTPLLLEKIGTEIEEVTSQLLPPEFEVHVEAADDNRIEMTITFKQGS